MFVWWRMEASVTPASKREAKMSRVGAFCSSVMTALVLGSAPAVAQSEAPPPEDDLPIPTLDIERVPPRTSMDLGVQLSYGTIAFVPETVDPWIGFGIRGAWGRNLGFHRLGVSGLVAVEGDFGVNTLLIFEPSFSWDYVSGRGLLLGAGIGPALAHWSSIADGVDERSFEIAPAAAVRIGASQTWSRLSRRVFVFLEPKVRLAGDDIVPVVALVVGSSIGR